MQMAQESMRCGSCFFELPTGAGHLPEDRPADLGVEAFYVGRIHPVHTVKNAFRLMQQSAERGCVTCEVLLTFMSRHTSTQNQIMWQGWASDAVTAFHSPPPLSAESGSPIPKEEDAERPPNVVFDFFCMATATDDPVPAFQQQRTRSLHPFLNIASHPSGDTGSDLAMARLQRWFSDCIASHAQCAKDQTPQLPARVLWLASPDTVRVIENCPHQEPYVCLSHRWSAPTVKISLRSANYARYQSGIATCELPRLFRDVIRLCLSPLGIRYLWIDSLCILQDSLVDWETIAATMGSIYENAYVTISADDNTDSDQPLFGRLPPAADAAEIPVPATASHPAGDAEKVFIRRQFPHPAGIPMHSPGTTAHGDVPLQRRGWVYQERALSRRIIHVTQAELSWECVETTRCECRLNEGHWNATRLRVPRNIFATSWERMVEEYSILELTFERDKLQALAGLARRVAARDRWRYAAGLWWEQLDAGFLWRRLKHAAARPRPKVLVAPTWSWASIDGPVWLTHGDRAKDVVFVEWAVKVAGVDPFGSLDKDSCLTVSGYVVEGVIHYGLSWEELVDKRSRVTTNPLEQWDSLARTELKRKNFMGVEIRGQLYSWLPDYAVDSPGPWMVMSGSVVRCLLCCDGGVAGMLLRSRGEKTTGYERIGVLDNDPFIRVPVEDLLQQASRESLVIY